MSNTIHSLMVVRKRLDFPPETFDRLRTGLDRHGVATEHINFTVGKKAIASTLLGISDLRWLHTVSGQRLDEPIVQGLSGYLRDHLPETTRDPITVPTLPLLSVQHTGRQPETLVIMGVGNPELEKERAMAKTLAEEFLGVDGQHVGWPSIDYSTAQTLVAVPNTDVADEVIELINNAPDLLPDELFLSSTIFQHIKVQVSPKTM